MFACLAATKAVGCDEEVLELGRRVAAAGAAIRDPDTPGAMYSITELGKDSRHYTMVRGWLALQLHGDESIVAAGAEGERPDIEERIAFLKRAIRAIDLE